MKIKTVPIYFISLFLVFGSCSQNNNHKEKKSSVKEYDDTSSTGFYYVKAFNLPKKMQFAGEQVPLQRFDVKEALDRELIVNSYWHSNTILLLKKANRWFPVIEPILEKNNIPADFKYVPLIESGLSNAVSPAGAAGFWQFMRRTAKEYNLEVSRYVDERYNVEKATEAACQYINNAYKYFDNDWTLAAASYNLGMGRLKENLEYQQADNYYDLFLNKETARYIYRILALKLIYNDPGKYGLKISRSHYYQPLQYTEVEVDSSINNLADFAINNGSSYKMLKIANPWLLRRNLKNRKNKKYTIKLPVLNTHAN